MCLIRFNKGWPKLSRNSNLRIGHESLPSSGALRRQSQKDSAEPPQAGDFSQVQSGGFRWPISRNLVALRWEFGCWKIHSNARTIRESYPEEAETEAICAAARTLTPGITCN
jgi:hypothetical protein